MVCYFFLPLSIASGRPCDVSDVLADLVEAVRPLAHKQQRLIKLSELSEVGQALQVAIEEPALRQALSNLIEGALLRTQVGGKVEIAYMRAPAGGALVVIDDDGPDMHYMVTITYSASLDFNLSSKITCFWCKMSLFHCRFWCLDTDAFSHSIRSRPLL